MKMRKHLSLILAAALFAFSFAGTANAVNVWDGTTGTVPQPAGGVIMITTGAQLAAFRDAVNNGNNYANYVIRLGDDINLNNIEWKPIGRFFNYPGYYLNPNPDNKAFSGIFDGAGHSITGLKVNNTAGNFNDRGETAALFGYIDYPASSKATAARSMTAADKAALDAAELGLTGEDYYRVLAERRDFYEAFGVKPVPVETRSVTPPYAAKGRVKNLKVYGTVTNKGGQGAAGVVCWNDGVIENCYFGGSVTVVSNDKRAYVGGICSLLGDDVTSQNTYVVNCAAMVDAKAHGGSFSYAGGIAGYCYAMNRGYIVNCSVQSGSKIDSYMDTGGVVGGFAYKVYNCSSAASEVTVNGIIPNQAGHFAGGIVGAFGAATNCYWLKTAGNALQPDYAVGNGTDTNGRKTSIAALPRASVLFGRKTIAVNGTAYAPKTTYPTGAAANTLSYSSWNSSDSSIAGVNSSGLVTGYSAGKAVISATITSSGSWWSTALAGTVGVTPESMFTVTQ
ncbi:MAG: Ig-like domain-containing protein [Synergistes jonesii]|uniref:Ig-like domain-containing protein n=1 Tax=Synergistes jonesii TaxID=2754 RepID=UPI002A7575BA|nr:Ig-like domain-containing protein [Synergistes jonesii]MDY2984947.1 Ig-like domain-containing protein [Synergistes jonesii]